MYQYLALISLRDSHPLPTRHSREPIGGFSSHFCISVSVLPFPYFGFRFSLFHLPHVGMSYEHLRVARVSSLASANFR